MKGKIFAILAIFAMVAMVLPVSIMAEPNEHANEAAFAPHGHQYDFVTITQGTVSGYGLYGSGYEQGGYFVIKDQETWEAVWEIHTQYEIDPVACPEVDFTKEQVIAAFMGSCPSTGYSVQVTDIRVSQGDTVVYVDRYHPGEGVIVGWMMTAPFHIVKMQKTSPGQDIVFEFNDITYSGVDVGLPELSHGDDLQEAV
jgi:hypothetical protein